MELDSFSIYVRLGFEHIADLAGVDHILFIITLCAWYTYKEWKPIIILVTAFTIGHSLTLALAALDMIRVNPDVIELLIPITIVITGFSNIYWVNAARDKSIRFNYFYALFFGLIHGMGFSNFFRELMGEGSAIVRPLLGFNIGLEIGQLLIVALFFAVYYIMQKLFRVNHQSWVLTLSGMGIGAAILLILEQVVG